MQPVHVRPAALGDWPAIARIYRDGIRTGHATFTTEAEIPAGPAWFAGKVPGQIFVAADSAGAVVGWSAASPTSKRAVYRGVVEVSVYVDLARQGAGIGSRLLGRLVTATEEAGIWTLQASIFPENEASLRLHAQHGFRRVGIREKIGRMDGRWRDTVFMERRSPSVW